MHGTQLGKIPAMLNISIVMYLGISIVPVYRGQSQQVISRISMQGLGGKVFRCEKNTSAEEREL